MQYRHPVYDLHVDQGRAILFGSDLRTGARSFCERRHAETVHTGGHDVAVAFWHRPAFNDGLAAKWYPPLNSPGGLGRARYVAGEIARLAAIDTDLCWAYQTHVVHQVLAVPRIDVFFPARRFFEFVEELVNLAHYNRLSATRSSVLGIFERWPAGLHRDEHGPCPVCTGDSPLLSAIA